MYQELLTTTAGVGITDEARKAVAAFGLCCDHDLVVESLVV
uniref:Uncharacterized protein n=1 Tax=Ficus carica TaxID=3494 RepID=A0AA88J8B4_FICCA|nr:hypothetical protein TIFTF001_036914 [Ficus carica]GMN67863.1 hypothetical protein TIFTF001_036923 [Ficus carica]